MNKLLRILHLEDEPDYSELVRSLLETDGIQTEVVLATNRADFEAALALEPFDVILADYMLPAYDGLQALRCAREKSPETPFLIISGTIGEQAAIESLKTGATDYVLKHWPERLVPAILRAVQEANERQQRLRAETELVRREKYFRALTENSLDILTILNAEGLFLYNTPSIKRLLGYEPSSLAGQSAFALVHPDDLTRVLEAFSTGLNQPGQTVTLDFRFRHRDGSWRFVETVGQSRLSDPDIAGIVVNVRDVTDRKRAEEDLREREKQYRLIFDGNPIPMWVFDQETLAFLEVNDAALQHYGYSRDEFLSMKLPDIRPPEEGPALVDYLHKLIPTGTPMKLGMAGVWRHCRKDGSLMDVQIKWSPISFRGRAALLVMADDITERKRIEHRDAALAKLGQNLSSATSPPEAARIIRDVADDLFPWNAFTLDLYSAERDVIDPILNVDTDGEGGRFEIPVTVLGREPSGLARRVIQNGADLILRDEPVAPLENVALIGDNLRPSASLMLAPIRNRTKVIGVLSVQSYAFKAYNQQDLSTLQTLADHCGGALERIRAEQALHESETTQKRLEHQLRQSQKMEAIGQLAGGVAHDFNNLLTVIHGHASLLLAGAALTGPSVRSAQQIAQAADRAAGLTRQLLAFSRRQVMQPRSLDVNEAVCNMTKMLSRILGEDIALQLNYFPQPALVLADAGMMEQVLLNLAVNSRDAMPKGGQLAIRISVQEVDARHLATHTEACAGRFVCLSVMDTGCGIAPENLPRIFEPFFTTKEVGKGTGLGLATVYGIIKQHQGWIQVESEPGKGTTFKVFLPCTGTAAEPAGAESPELSVRGGTETILVVEDEAPVRELVCNLLVAEGYKVLQADSGAKALEVWETSKARVDLLLTDLVMPDRMNGRELAEKLWIERPKLKVIFTSGYSAEVVGADFVLQRGLNYLQKPYPPQKLALSVRDCLDAVN